MSIHTDSDFAFHLVEAISNHTLDPKIFQKAPADLIHQLQRFWNPLFHQIKKVKSHRQLEDAENPEDLYTILGNDLSDRVAKQINQMDMPHFQDAADSIFEHTNKQMDALLTIYRYLAELNALHSSLKIEKERDAATTHQFNTLDAYTSFQSALCQWDVGPDCWVLETDLPELPEIIAQGCPVGATVAYKVWQMFRTFRWRPHNLLYQ